MASRLTSSFAALPLLFTLAFEATAGEHGDEVAEARDLAGLWRARRDFGPRTRGPLTIRRDDTAWTAEIDSHRVRVAKNGDVVSFELPGERGSFLGRLEADRSISGHWTQPETRHGGLCYASPVNLLPAAADTWRGNIIPFDDTFTCFLVLQERADGSLGAFLRNPDRNWGVFAYADRVEVQGDQIHLIGEWRNRGNERVLTTGRYRDWQDSFTFNFRNATFEFRRVEGDPVSDFYARGANPEPWTYHAPPALDDGWPVATLEEVGMSEEPFREMIETVIDPPARDAHTPYVHGMLVARGGKLVVEEYFHGFHRGVPHDTRSAQKSLGSFLVGAAMEAGEPVDLSMPVYETIGAPYFHDDLDERTQRMSLVHLLTMSSGLDCDDSDDNSPGNEENLQSQEDNPDWYDYTLKLDTIREPGEKSVYCSINPNLAGNVLTAATGKSLETLFHDYVASPLEFSRYHLCLQPTGETYYGGGSFFLPRDFMKLGQVIMDGGTWKDHRVVSAEFAHDSIQPLTQIGEREYGYLWWVTDLDYRGSTVRAFYAGGNGGQVVMGVPELDIVALFYAGNYSDQVMYMIQEKLVPDYVLRAIE